MRPVTAVVVLAVLAISQSGFTQVLAPQYVRMPDVIYGRRAGLALTMEVFTPIKSNGLGVVWIVSSNGTSSREQTNTPSFERRISPLLRDGYTVFAVIHGSAPAFNVQDFINDASRAVRFVRHSASDFHVDGRRLAVSGSSSGGAIALMIAMQGDDGDPAAPDPVDRTSSRVQVAASFFPPTDFLNFGADGRNIIDVFQQSGGTDPSFQFYDADAKTGTRTLITDRARLVGILRSISPVTFVTPDDPPTLLIHGDADQAVPLQQSQRLIERLKSANVDAQLIIRKGMRHAYPEWEDDTELISTWFDSHLHPGTLQ